MPSAAAADAAAPARARGRRSSTKTSSTAPTASSAPAAAASGVEAAAAPALSRAKLLAQQLAKREIHTHGIAAAAAAGARAAFTEPATGAAAPGSAWVGADELLYAGSQAQDDALLLGGDNSMQVYQATGQDIFLCFPVMLLGNALNLAWFSEAAFVPALRSGAWNWTVQPALAFRQGASSCACIPATVAFPLSLRAPRLLC